MSRLLIPIHLAKHHVTDIFAVGVIHFHTVVTGAHHIANTRGQMGLVTHVRHKGPSAGWTCHPLLKHESSLRLRELAPLVAHMASQVVVSYMVVITIVVPFHKGGHGCDNTIVIVCMVQIQLVLHLVRSLMHNIIEEVPGDDMQLVGCSQGSLEPLPLLSTAKDALRYTFENKESLLV